MPVSGAEKNTRRQVLEDLARELNRPGGPGCRMRRTARLVPYLSVRKAARRRLRVYCAGVGGVYALLTGDGQLILLDSGIAAAAREITTAAGQACLGHGPAANTVIRPEGL